MCPGLSNDLPQIDDARKTAVISRELKRLNIDIAAQWETRLPSNGSLKEEDYTFFCRVHDVGFPVRNSLLSSVEPPSEGTARVPSLRLTTTLGPVNILSAYAPMLCSTAGEKDKFYSQLETAIKEIPPSEDLYLLGDFNARIGSDHFSWSQCIGHFGRDSSSYAPSTISASQTRSSPQNPTTECPGGTPDLVTGTSWISLSPADPCWTVSCPPAAITALTATPTTLLLPAKCVSTAQSRRGVPASIQP